MISISSSYLGTFKDQSESLDKTTLALVRAAMSAGLESFTTPTSGFDEHRMEWRTRKWVAMLNNKPTCFLVAFLESNAHFEIIGPQVTLTKVL